MYVALAWNRERERERENDVARFLLFGDVCKVDGRVSRFRMINILRVVCPLSINSKSHVVSGRLMSPYICHTVLHLVDFTG